MENKATENTNMDITIDNYSNYDKEMFTKEFIRREDNFLRAPYNPEVNFYSTIKAGDTETIKELCKEELIKKPGLGKLSNDPVQNMKFHFVITTALAARYCISGGMDLSTAYNISDFYIQKADACKTAKEISDLHPKMCLEYTKRMRALNKKMITSNYIIKCIDYIYDNLHNRITVNDLADYVALSPTYLSKLFKKEVGVSINEYIRRQKMETAKNMLKYSDINVALISSILAFPTQSYFTERFKAYTGLTPTTYRSQNLQKE